MHRLLSKIESPLELHAMSAGELTELAGEIRDALCNLLSVRTAHFASNLGVVELCLALHSTFNFRRDRLARAGLSRSGVAVQANRLLERHEAAYGAYWKSYDFRSGAGRGNLVRFPLGPANLFQRHPFAEQAFVQDGGEIIFHLPNGLQGYMLVNGKEERINEGPADVVRDRGSLALSWVRFSDYTANRAELEAAARELFEVLTSGAVHLPAPRCLPLAQAAEAHRLLESGETTGALVLVP